MAKSVVYPTGGRARGLSRRSLAIAAALATVYWVWGSTYLATDVALRAFPPFLLTGARFVAAGGLLLALGLARGERLPTPRQWWHAAVVGTGMLALTLATGTLAQTHVSSSLAAILYATEPMWLVVFAMFTGHRTTRAEWAGIAVGMAGIVLLNLDDELSASAVGVALLLFSAANWSLWAVLRKRFDVPAGTPGYAAQLLGGSAPMLILSQLAGEPLPTHIVPEAWVAFAFLTLFGTAAAFSAYTYLTAHTRPTVAVSYAYVNPVVAVALGAALAGDRITPLMAVALALIVFSVVFMVADARALPFAAWLARARDAAAAWADGLAALDEAHPLARAYSRTYTRAQAFARAGRRRWPKR